MKRILCLAVAFAMTAPAAFAHINFVTRDAAQKSTYKGVLGVGHGCDGAATVKVTVRIPEGVIAVKPMPKPGWTIDIVMGPAAKAYDYYGASVTEVVKEIVWQGGALPDAYYDEFAFRAYLTDALPVGSTVWFPVVQDCATGKTEWTEIPASAEAEEPEHPAAGLTITKPQSGH
ncbi:MAG TPA: YcnI family protein [Paenirhodobacter sp.]